MLRYITSTVTACALAGAVSVFAQAPTPAPPPAQPEQQPAPAQPEQQPAPAQPEAPPVAKETLTGCVMEAKTTDGGKAFVLNKAKGGTAEMYVLAGASDTELATNVNKEVEITGPVQQPNLPPAAEAASPDKPKVLRPPSLTVESVKVIAETCTR